MERSATLRFPGGSSTLSNDELRALAWLIKVGGHTGAIASLSNAGGSFGERACAQLAKFVRDAEKLLEHPLEVWQPKYRTNVCLGSTYGWEVVQKSGLAYLNRNVDPPVVFCSGRRSKRDAQTLGDVAAVRDVFTKLGEATRACVASGEPLVVEMTGGYENF